MSIAFVLGNGKSRISIDISKLKNYGDVYGCNALYRDYHPDYLIAVDPPMVKEIHQSEIWKTVEVWTNPRKQNQDLEGLNFFNPSKGWSSGPTALWMASQKKYEYIFIIGFDYASIDKKLNNVYGSTPNYKNKNDVFTYYGNWERQTMETIKEHKHINYYRILTVDYTFIPDKLQHISNLKHINTEELRDILLKFPLKN
jgi:hypothetical protein